MSLVVQKFGGSSLSDSHHIFNVAKKIIKYKQNNNNINIIVVVSAQGDTTDNLVNLSNEININKLQDNNFKRELDMLLSSGEQISASLLAIAIQNLGHKAISLTGWQAGITTNSNYTDSSITNIITTRINSELEKNNIVIITGFQGVNSENNITTLGRGGSDTSAVAIAGIMNADFCEIYTDVDGVYTADPRIVPTARKLNSISSQEMYLLSSFGSQVLNSNSVLTSQKYNINLKVLSSFENNINNNLNNSGTVITSNLNKNINNINYNYITGIATEKKLIKICINNNNLNKQILNKNINLIQKFIKEINLKPVNKQDLNNFIYYIIEEQNLHEFLSIINNILDSSEVSYEKNKSKISVVNLNQSYNINIASVVFETLHQNNINIELTLCDNNHVSVIINSENLHRATNLIHNKLFEEDYLFDI